jgi:hypothetical protein
MPDLQGSDPKAYNLQDALGPNMTVEVRTEEHPDDRAARLVRETREHLFGLWVKGAVFLLLVVVLLYSGWRLQDPELEPQTRELAVTVITSVISGFLGYFVGRRL